MKNCIGVIAFAVAFAACSQSQTSSIPALDATTKSKVASMSAGPYCSLQTQTIGPSSVSGDLAVGGVSATDAWTIVPVPYSQRNAAMVSIYHFNGSAWTLVPSPTGAYTGWHAAQVHSIAAIASNDAWAVGSGEYPQSTGGFNTTPFILHWTGNRWLFFRNPPSFKSGTGADLQQVSADSSNDVWVAGTAGTPPATTYLARWNGSSWREISSRDATDGVTSLKAFGPKDVWFTSRQQSNIVFHWNGTLLQAQPLPPLHGQLPSALTLAGTSATDLWVAGYPDYIAHRSATWSPFVVTGNEGAVRQILSFRRDYALVTTGTSPNLAGLMVYNGVDRWRPTANPFLANNENVVAVSASTTTSGTNFWATLTDAAIFEPPILNFPAFAALVVCPPNPPPPAVFVKP